MKICPNCKVIQDDSFVMCGNCRRLLPKKEELPKVGLLETGAIKECSFNIKIELE